MACSKLLSPIKCPLEKYTEISMNSGSSKVSFELFPPKTENGISALKTTVELLKQANPHYFSVTFGANGSLQNPTYNTVNMLKSELGVAVVPHLSCVGTDKASVISIIDSYVAKGIDRLVILRGDLPSGHAMFDGDFRYASDLVHFIREEMKAPIKIDVGAYPECHPQAKNLQQDLENFKIKVDAGADAAITQYFFNIDAYENFVEQCRTMGITIPIIPGIMPITNLDQLARFSKMCGAEIPQWLTRKLQSYEGDKQSITQFGIEVVSKLCEKLLGYGVPELHFYTLNKAQPSLTILQNVSLCGEINNVAA